MSTNDSFSRWRCVFGQWVWMGCGDTYSGKSDCYSREVQTQPVFFNLLLKTFFGKNPRFWDSNFLRILGEIQNTMFSWGKLEEKSKVQVICNFAPLWSRKVSGLFKSRFWGKIERWCNFYRFLLGFMGHTWSTAFFAVYVLTSCSKYPVCVVCERKSGGFGLTNKKLKVCRGCPLTKTEA